MRDHCPTGNRWDSSKTICVSDPSCAPKKTIHQNCTTYQTFVIPGECTSFEYCNENGMYGQTCCIDGYVFNRNIGQCDSADNVSPKCTP